MKRQGFDARVLVRTNGLSVGSVVYIKPVEYLYSTPTLFAVLNRKTGVPEYYIDGNEFRNRFEKL